MVRVRQANYEQSNADFSGRSELCTLSEMIMDQRLPKINNVAVL